MTKTPPKKKRPARRLKNVVVEEVSLVDNPAVPEANFIIAKRDEVPESEATEAEPAEVEAEGVDLEKGRLLTAKQAARLEKIRDELDDILKTSRRVMKGEVPAVTEATEPTSNPSSPVKKTAIEEAVELLKAQEAQQAVDLDSMVLKAFRELRDEAKLLREQIKEATGKVGD